MNQPTNNTLLTGIQIKVIIYSEIYINEICFTFVVTQFKDRQTKSLKGQIRSMYESQCTSDSYGENRRAVGSDSVPGLTVVLAALSRADL